MRRASLIALRLVALPVTTGCAMRIAPPAVVDEPVEVFVIDYGYHSSLVLPDESGGAEEWAYGWWDWFALNNDAWYHALPLLACPGRGTLGRHEMRPPIDVQTLPARLNAISALALTVEKSLAGSLRAELRDEHEAARQRWGLEVRNQRYGYVFVPSERLYWIGYTCNSAVAEWLDRLGCRVRGARQFAAFTLDGAGPAGR